MEHIFIIYLNKARHPRNKKNQSCSDQRLYMHRVYMPGFFLVYLLGFDVWTIVLCLQSNCFISENFILTYKVHVMINPRLEQSRFQLKTNPLETQCYC